MEERAVRRRRRTDARSAQAGVPEWTRGDPHAGGTERAHEGVPPRKKRPMRDMGEDSEAGTPSVVSAGDEPSASKRFRAGEDSGADTPGTEFGAATPGDSPPAGGDE